MMSMLVATILAVVVFVVGSHIIAGDDAKTTKDSVRHNSKMGLLSLVTIALATKEAFDIIFHFLGKRNNNVDPPKER